MTTSLTQRLRTSELILEILNHDNKDELIALMEEQVIDDTDQVLV